MTDLEHMTTDLVVSGTHALPLGPDEAREAMRTYQEISRALIVPADDMQTIRTSKGPREFPKRSAFQKLANAYRVSTAILSRELTHDDAGALVRCDVIVRATHPDGRFAEGDGACARSEERFTRGDDKIDHDLPATAVTRATNRAISNLVAFGAVSAEEASEVDAGTNAAPTNAQAVPELPSWAQPFEDVSAVAGWIVDILKGAGDEQAAEQTSRVGQAIFDEADGAIPRIVATTIAHLHRIVTAATPDGRAAAAMGEAFTEPDTPTEDTP